MWRFAKDSSGGSTSLSLPPRETAVRDSARPWDLHGSLGSNLADRRAISSSSLAAPAPSLALCYVRTRTRASVSPILLRSLVTLLSTPDTPPGLDSPFHHTPGGARTWPQLPLGAALGARPSQVLLEDRYCEFPGSITHHIVC